MERGHPCPESAGVHVSSRFRVHAGRDARAPLSRTSLNPNHRLFRRLTRVSFSTQPSEQYAE